MRPLLYILAVLLLIPVILIGVLAVVLANPDLYRQQLSDTFEAETGLILDIKGEITWRYWPLVALDVRDLEIRPVEDSEPVAKFQSASVDLELLPLLMGGNNIAIDGIFIDQLDINLQVDKEGNANWLPDRDAGAAEDTSVDSGDTGGFDLNIAIIEITSARIEYRDLSANQHYVVGIPSLTTGSVFYDEPTEVRGTIHIEDRIGEISAQTNLDGRISFNQGFTHFTFQDLALDSRVSGTDLADLAFVTTLTGEFDSDQGTASIDQGTFILGDLESTFSLSVNDLSGSPHFAGAVTTNNFNARKLLEALDIEVPEMANESALTNIEVSTNLTGELPEIQLGQLLAKWDQSILKGSVSLSLEEKTGLNYDLSLDRINVSDYLPPVPDSDDETADANQTSAEPEDFEVIPTELLNEIDVNGNLQIGELVYDTYSFTDADINVNNRNGKLDAKFKANGYQGDLGMSASVTTGTAPGGTLKFTVNGLDITALTEWEWITGTLGVSSDTRFKGTQLSEILASITGPTRFNIQDGTLDVTPVKEMAATVDGMRGKTSSVSEWPDKMPFQRLEGEHQLNNGIADNQVFAFRLENVNASGEGGVDYWNNQLEYDVNIALEETEGGRFKVNPQIAGIKWPLHCEGALDASPVDSCRPDSDGIRSVIGQAAKQEVKRKTDEKVEEKKEELQEKARDLLKGIFDR